MTEEWRPVVGFEGLYEVSDQGRVRSAPRPKTRGGLLRPGGHRSGHLHVVLSRAGRVCTRQVHRLVLEAFTGPCPEGQECRHLNGDPADNRHVNLCWGTRSENVQDMIRHGTHNPYGGRRSA